MSAGRSAYFATACCQNWPSESSQSGLSVGPEVRESNKPCEFLLVGCSLYVDCKLEARRTCRPAELRKQPEPAEVKGDQRGGIVDAVQTLFAVKVKAKDHALAQGL